jgi:hypothetical protein
MGSTCSRPVAIQDHFSSEGLEEARIRNEARTRPTLQACWPECLRDRDGGTDE